MATFYDMDAGVISSPTLRRFGQIMGHLNQHIRLCRLNDLNAAWKQQVRRIICLGFALEVQQSPRSRENCPRIWVLRDGVFGRQRVKA
jgi:hypothetical protein